MFSNNIAIGVICWALVFTCPAAVHHFSLKGESEVIVSEINIQKEYSLNIIINGYNVNCKGDRMIVWGHAKKINNDNPQDSSIVLIDLKKNKVIKESGFSKGIFGVSYLSGKNVAYIASGGGYLLDTNTSSISNIDPVMDITIDGLFEKCAKNKSWSYNRYPDN
ncbi:hypothetical protein ACT5AM_001750 [Cronobacter malonaticus]